MTTPSLDHTASESCLPAHCPSIIMAVLPASLFPGRGLGLALRCLRALPHEVPSRLFHALLLRQGGFAFPWDVVLPRVQLLTLPPVVLPQVADP